MVTQFLLSSTVWDLITVWVRWSARRVSSQAVQPAPRLEICAAEAGTTFILRVIASAIYIRAMFALILSAVVSAMSLIWGNFREKVGRRLRVVHLLCLIFCLLVGRFDRLLILLNR